MQSDQVSIFQRAFLQFLENFPSSLFSLQYSLPRHYSFRSFTLPIFRSFAFYSTRNRQRRRWRRSRFLARDTPEILGFNCALDISGERKALMDRIRGRACTDVLLQRVLSDNQGRMFNWAFGCARPNANVSHNPACQLTLLETPSMPVYTTSREPIRDKSNNWLWIDVCATACNESATKKLKIGDYWKLMR